MKYFFLMGFNNVEELLNKLTFYLKFISEFKLFIIFELYSKSFIP